MTQPLKSLTIPNHSPYFSWEGDTMKGSPKVRLKKANGTS